jgi:hypothetical protein
MINIFLAIIVDAYAGVTADAKERVAHTVFGDLQKVRAIQARAIFSMSGINCFGPSTAVGTKVNKMGYKAAKEATKSATVAKWLAAAKANEAIDVVEDLIMTEPGQAAIDVMQDTYGRLVAWEKNDEATIEGKMEEVRVELAQQLNEIEYHQVHKMAELIKMEERIVKVLKA